MKERQIAVVATATEKTGTKEESVQVRDGEREKKKLEYRSAAPMGMSACTIVVLMCAFVFM